MKVVFLDRDGVLNRDRADYVKNLQEFEMLRGAAEAVARLNRMGYRVVVVSNQAGVGKGLIPEEVLSQITEALHHAVQQAGGEIGAVYYCTHRPEDDCDCRKPRPRLILKACRALGIQPSECVFIGDAERDVKAAHAAGCGSVLVLTGFATEEDVEHFEAKPDYVADDLHDAVNWILVRDGKTFA